MASNHSILLYALSTCVHCRHVAQFFAKHNVPCSIIYMDTLVGKERSEHLERLRGVNPRVSFPTVVLNEGADVIVGFQPQRLSRLLAL